MEKRINTSQAGRRKKRAEKGGKEKLRNGCVIFKPDTNLFLHVYRLPPKHLRALIFFINCTKKMVKPLKSSQKRRIFHADHHNPLYSQEKSFSIKFFFLSPPLRCFLLLFISAPLRSYIPKNSGKWYKYTSPCEHEDVSFKIRKR